MLFFNLLVISSIVLADFSNLLTPNYDTGDEDFEVSKPVKTAEKVFKQLESNLDAVLKLPVKFDNLEPDSDFDFEREPLENNIKPCHENLGSKTIFTPVKSEDDFRNFLTEIPETQKHNWLFMLVTNSTSADQVNPKSKTGKLIHEIYKNSFVYDPEIEKTNPINKPQKYRDMQQILLQSFRHADPSGRFQLTQSDLDRRLSGYKKHLETYYYPISWKNYPDTIKSDPAIFLHLDCQINFDTRHLIPLCRRFFRHNLPLQIVKFKKVLDPEKNEISYWDIFFNFWSKITRSL